MTITTDYKFRLVPVDLYRNIHKGIRAELFAVTAAAGSIDPNDDGDVGALVGHVASVAGLLTMHAEHEEHLDELLQEHAPIVAEQIASDHETHTAHLAAIVELAGSISTTGAAHRRTVVQLLHLDLASFTGAYLAHQDIEERYVMPALHDAVGPHELGRIQREIMGGISPEVMARSLALMLPAMNIDDRTEHLGAMQANAPAEAFDRVWGLTASVLEPRDLNPLATRLGVRR